MKDELIHMVWPDQDQELVVGTGARSLIICVCVCCHSSYPPVLTIVFLPQRGFFLYLTYPPVKLSLMWIEDQRS